MQAVVRVPRTKRKLFEINGRIPRKVIKFLKDEFGRDVLIHKDDSSLVDPFQSQWYKSMMASLTPGKALKHYRENRGLTQSHLAEELGRTSGRTLSVQNISDMEHGRRSISKEIARNLAKIFETSTDRFV